MSKRLTNHINTPKRYLIVIVAHVVSQNQTFDSIIGHFPDLADQNWYATTNLLYNSNRESNDVFLIQ